MVRPVPHAAIGVGKTKAPQNDRKSEYISVFELILVEQSYIHDGGKVQMDVDGRGQVLCG